MVLSLWTTPLLTPAIQGAPKVVKMFTNQPKPIKCQIETKNLIFKIAETLTIFVNKFLGVFTVNQNFFDKL